MAKEVRFKVDFNKEMSIKDVQGNIFKTKSVVVFEPDFYVLEAFADIYEKAKRSFMLDMMSKRDQFASSNEQGIGKSTNDNDNDDEEQSLLFISEMYFPSDGYKKISDILLGKDLLGIECKERQITNIDVSSVRSAVGVMSFRKIIRDVFVNFLKG